MTAAPEMDDLVVAAGAGDPVAVDALLRAVRPLVVRYCRTRLGSSERAHVSPDDVAQEVCLAVLRALPTYEDQGRPFLAFVYGIAAHKVADAHRAAGRDRSDPVDELPEELDDRDGPEQHAVDVSGSESMGALLATLPAKQREILVLRVVVGLSAEETAEAVGSTPGAVRVAQHRALGKLRGLLVPAGPVRSAPSPAPAPRAAGRPAARPVRAGRPVDPVGPPAPVSRRGPGRAGPGGPGRDWTGAPRTGDAGLDRMLDLADAHVARVAGGSASAFTGPVALPASPRRQELADEDARMARAAREHRAARSG